MGYIISWFEFTKPFYVGFFQPSRMVQLKDEIINFPSKVENHYTSPGKGVTIIYYNAKIIRSQTKCSSKSFIGH